MDPNKCAIADCEELTTHQVCNVHWKTVDLAFRRLVYKRLSKYRCAVNQALQSIGAPPNVYERPEGALDAGITVISEDVPITEEYLAIRDIKNRPKIKKLPPVKKAPKVWRAVS